MIKLFQFLIFLILQILFIPFALIGLLLALYKEMYVSKKLGVSFTAGQAIQIRWIMHYFGTRADKDTVEFIKHFPIESHIGFLGMFGAAIIANRICGYTLSMAKIPEPGKESLMTFLPTRTITFDRIVEKYSSQVDQIVNMGAGFDLRLLKYTKGKDVKIFELDQEKTQNLKLETMKKADLKHDWITYIPVDFREESWVEKLTQSGFDRAKKTYFHWEAVADYLEEDVVKDTLKKMSELCSQGSIIGQSFASKALVTGEGTYAMKRTKELMEKFGEPWLYGIDMSGDARASVESLLSEFGLVLTELTLLGHKRKTGKPFFAIAVCEKR